MYNTKTFDDIYPDDETFLTEWKDAGCYSVGLVKDSNVKVLYWLIVARYGNSPIINNDENQFRAKVNAIIFRFAPTWEKKLEIQGKFRGLNLDSGDLFAGTKQIHNAAYNPQTAPGTGSSEEIDYINTQNVDLVKKGKAEGLSQLWNLLEDDVSETIIRRFEPLFLKVVLPNATAIYPTEED